MDGTEPLVPNGGVRAGHAPKKKWLLSSSGSASRDQLLRTEGRADPVTCHQTGGSPTVLNLLSGLVGTEEEL